MPGEFDFIDWVRSQQPPTKYIPTPAGDDLAVLRWPDKDLLLVGVDQVIDGVHFDSARHSPREVGRKVMNRNLSDCAAMAALPVAAIATVALPRSTTIDYAKELYQGLRDAADEFDCKIVGGDTASWDGKLVMTVTILGRSDGIAPVLRSTARPGDRIYVTGPLGGSILGRHLDFQPRIHLARQLVKRGAVTAMIDLSDGVSRDLRHICQQSQVGAVIDAAKVPIHDDAHTLSRQDNKSPLHHALHDGEDHELLFTGPPGCADAHEIGVIAPPPDVLLRTPEGDRPLEAKGWEHSLGR